MAVSLWWRSCHEPLKKKTQRTKTKVFSIKLDWAGSSGRGSLRCERNANKRVLRVCILLGQFVALDACLEEHPSPGCTTQQKHSCNPGDLRAKRGKSRGRQRTKSLEVRAVLLNVVMFCTGRCFSWSWAVETRGSVYVKAKNVSSTLSNKAQKSSSKTNKTFIAEYNNISHYFKS